MKLSIIFLTIFICSILVCTNLNAQELPDYFTGKVIAEGKKAEWLPDGSAISYVLNNAFYLYDMKKQKSKKITDMQVAQYSWINNDSTIVIEWPENVTEKKRVQKIVNYWIVTRSGKKSKFAADTMMTRKIPDYNKPVRLPDDVIAIRKNPGWPEYDLPQSKDYIAFTSGDYDVAGNVSAFRFVTATEQEGGSIHFKNIEVVNDKTLTIGKKYYKPVLSPDYNKILAYTNAGLDIIGSDGVKQIDLLEYLTEAESNNLNKFFGARWNNNSDGFVYYELYNDPDDFVNIGYFDLNKKERIVLTQSFYYGNHSFRLAQDDRTVLAMMNYLEKSYIVLLDIPKVSAGDDE